MKSVLCLLILFTLPLAAAPPLTEHEARALYERRMTEIQTLWQANDLEKSRVVMEELMAQPELTRIGDIDSDLRYNLACIYARLAQKDKAFEQLRALASAHTMNPAQVENDADFTSLRGEEAYKDVLEQMRAKWAVQDRFWNSPAMKTPFKEKLSDDEKIAGLTRYWAEAKYNFAWFELVPELDWDAAYIEYLPKVRAAATTLDYYRVLMQFAALLKDGHTNVAPPDELTDRWSSAPALTLALVEGRVLIDTVADPALTAARVRRGCELIAIDGVATRDYAARHVRPYQAASSPQDLDLRSLVRRLLYGAAGSTVKLQLRDASGTPVEAVATRITPAERKKRNVAPAPKPFELEMRDGNIAYVRLNTFMDKAVVEEFEKAWPEIKKATALVIDVRRNGGGNSGFGNQILSRLTAQGGAVEAARTRLYRPAYRAWGTPEEWTPEQKWTTAGRGEDVFKGRVALLVGAATFSAAEDFSASFDMLRVGTIIGEPTGGSTGQPLSIRLPGGGWGQVCALQMHYADGRTIVGTGIQPHLHAAQSVEDFRANKDTVLDTALAELRR